MSARVTWIEIEGFRVIEKLSFELRALNVLIGENGTGKSTVVEAIELLRKAVSLTGAQFFTALYDEHDGARSVRSVPGRVAIGAAVTLADGRRYRYRFELECGRDRTFRVSGESLIEERAVGGSRVLIERDRSEGRLLVEEREGLRRIPTDPERLLLQAWGEAHVEIGAVGRAFAGIEVFPPLPTGPAWAADPHGSGPRFGGALRPAPRLERDASNLANVFQELRNAGPTEWQHTLDLVQLLLGMEIEDVVLSADPGGLRLALGLRIQGVGEVPAALLSDGELAALSWIALTRLPRPSSPLIAFDEPDLHLHPGLVMRIADLADRMSEDRTVLLTTHSDRLLDALADPASAVVLLDRGAGFATRALRPDPAQLAHWIERYAGLGKARAEGYGRMIFTEEASPASRDDAP